MSYKQKLENLGIILRRSNGQTKTTCPKCSSTRKNKKEFCLSVDIDKGVFKCHNCDWKGNVAAYESKNNYRKLDKNLFLKDAKITDSRKYLNGRGLSDHTIDVFMLFEKVLKFPPKGENEKWQEKKCIAFPYFRGTELINVQYRSRDKDFRLEKDAELIFYNINSLSGARKAIITEGQIDAMSAFEVGFGDKRNEEKLNTLINEKAEEIRKQYEEENEYNKKQKKSGHSAEELKNIDEDVIEFTPEMDSLSFLSGWGVVSVPNGASENLDFLDNCAESFFGIDEIIIATDGDEKGIMMREALITRFGAERCKYIDWDFENSGIKDFNDALTKRGKDYIIELVKNAKGIPISGIHYLHDIADDMWKSYWHKTRQGSSTGFKEFDDYFVWKKGEINIFHGYAHMGKTTMANQLFIAKSVVDGWKWAVFCPENYPATTYYNGLIMSFIGKEIHPKNEAYKMKPQEYEAGMNFINDHFYFIYPDELHDIETIHEKFKYLILKKGVHGVIIDPLNQLDKTQKAFQRDDQYLSDLYMNIKRFALSHQVCYNVIAHPNSPREKNPLPVPTAYDLWGGAMNFNKADNILCIHRENLQEPFTQVHIQKNKVVDTGGSLAGTHFVGRYLWQEKRFYFQEQNPITDYWAERTKRENGEYSSEFKFTEYNNDPENEIPPF
jgi:twinkle protein